MTQSNEAKGNPEDILKTAQFEGMDGTVKVQANQTETHDIETDSGTLENNAETISALSQQLEAANAQIATEQDTVLRLQAEMDNMRRRNDKQVEDAHKYAVQRFVEGLLPVLDSLESGMQVSGDLNSIREGMQLTLKQFEDTLGRFNVEAINPVGQPFNPEQHQAVSALNSPNHSNDTVVNVFQKGYSLNGRVVRPAMVQVCKK
ncbi:nucleotide exchange factor GrpE [Thiofilum flexile]|uniref:nucleotide exchange factor GrpE n=1 Tax=Thiofilum flexile TaxID=125627 RepID=UPI000367C026|nr:nucleotide exchange factor GrpE [Thiofilum flexile]